jgi:D-alanyl-lipoteichoic acid acyltransferase DltB (MBOAT superfamily)
MLFHSPEFLFGFLPLTLLGFVLLERTVSLRAALGWFTISSLFFYGYWDPSFLLLLLGSIAFNYPFGILLRSERRSKLLLGIGIAVNITILGLFKYADFFLSTFNAVSGTDFALLHLVLPLGISFFTFEQIAWLIENFHKQIAATSLRNYTVFLTNFPKLIAGPIIRPHEFLPQLDPVSRKKIGAETVAIGLTIFLLGLFKKVVLADSMVPFVDPVFHASATGVPVSFVEAWAATLAYTFQIYFDFSGYSDMAIGLARMFGIILPRNFHSPYKSKNIIEFWRRWHMSLTRFLRDYVYIALGGNRRGALLQYRNLFLVMLLSGLWHGAGWTFVLWGALHGGYLLANHLWRKWRGASTESKVGSVVSWAITFIGVVFAWALFRSENSASAVEMIHSMFGFKGIVLLPHALSSTLIIPAGEWVHGAKIIGTLFLFAILLPNTQQFMRYFRPTLDGSEEELKGLFAPLVFRPTTLMALSLAVIAACSMVLLMLGRETEFLYFQF